MKKRLFFICLAALLSLLVLRFHETDTRESLPTTQKVAGLRAAKVTGASQQNADTNSRLSAGNKEAYFKSSLADDNADEPIIDFLNRLLAADKPDEIMEPGWKYASSICRKRLNFWSELACEAVRHHERLMSEQDDRDLPMATDWQWVEQMGGGTENSDDGKNVLLKNDLFSRDSNLDGDLESAVEALTEMAILEPSSEKRQQVLEQAIMTRSEAYIPLFLKLVDDVDPATSTLAIEGLRQMQVFTGKLAEIPEVQERF